MGRICIIGLPETEVLPATTDGGGLQHSAAVAVSRYDGCKERRAPTDICRARGIDRTYISSLGTWWASCEHAATTMVPPSGGNSTAIAPPWLWLRPRGGGGRHTLFRCPTGNNLRGFGTYCSQRHRAFSIPVIRRLKRRRKERMYVSTQISTTQQARVGHHRARQTDGGTAAACEYRMISLGRYRSDLLFFAAWRRVCYCSTK